MRALLAIIRLELVAIWRSWTLALMMVASVAWMLLFPFVLKGDGTAEGAREMYIRYSLGGVFALLVVSLLASATGVLARERGAKRLQLTVVRPVRYFFVAFGKMIAHVMAGALVLAVVSVILCFRVDPSAPCAHVLSPVLPPPQEEAETMYEAYMKDPDTPEQVKKAKKSTVLRLLTQRAFDHYQTISTNAVARWTFNLPEDVGRAGNVGVRMRFTNQYEMRQDVVGRFRLLDRSGTVSNITQAVVTVPLSGTEADPSVRSGLPELTFANAGRHPLMLRPRKDINLLVQADCFAFNLVRAYLVMVAVLAFVIAFGTFLSASLSRPVAMFVAVVILIVSEMCPSVIDQCQDTLDAGRLDRLGLALTRMTAEVTRPISAMAPLESLPLDECIEWRDVIRMCAADLVLLPVLLALLSALVMPYKQDNL